MMEFRITGRLTPYVRMTQRGKYTDPRVELYLTSQARVKAQLKNQMVEHGWSMLPKKTPISVEIWLQVSARPHNFDLENVQKALLDAAQGIVYQNDLWIDEYRAVRTLGSENVAILSISTLTT